MLASAFLLPSLVCGTAFLINFVAIYYHASRAIPFGTMVAVACICLFVILPLTLVGTVLGRNLSGSPGETTRFEPGVGARPIANSVLADFFSQLQCMPARAQADPSLILFHTFFYTSVRTRAEPRPIANIFSRSLQTTLAASTPSPALSQRRSGSWSRW